MSARRLLRKRWQEFLAFMHDVKAKEAKLEDILVVVNFWTYAQKNYMAYH